MEGDENTGFRAISKNPKEEDVIAFMQEHGKETEISSFVRAYADAISKIDSGLMEKMKRRYYFESVQDGQMQLNYAAQKSNMTTEEFRAEMENHGYRLPHELQTV